MTEIEKIDPFAFNDRPVRALLLDGEPAFVHADVCTVLEIGNPSDALRRLDPDEFTLVSIDGPNGRPVRALKPCTRPTGTPSRRFCPPR